MRPRARAAAPRKNGTVRMAKMRTRAPASRRSQRICVGSKATDWASQGVRRTATTKRPEKIPKRTGSRPSTRWRRRARAVPLPPNPSMAIPTAM
jgi:hypothetical protein